MRQSVDRCRREWRRQGRPDKGEKVADVTDTGGIQNQNPPVVPPDQKGPPIPPNQTVVPPDPTGPTVVPSRVPPRRPPVAPPETVAPPDPVEDPEPPASRGKSSSGTMSARLLSAINTRTASQGDTFTAKLEDGPYRGGILSGSIKKLKKSRKNVELELEFDKLNGKAIPVGLDLVDISNANGVKGVDEEKDSVGFRRRGGGRRGHRKDQGGTKGALIGAGAGAGAGFLVSMKLMTRATDVDLQPGSHLVLREAGR